VPLDVLSHKFMRDSSFLQRRKW